MVEGNGTSFGDIVTLTCRSGFKKVSGSAVIECGADEQWMGTPLQCEGKCLSAWNVRVPTPQEKNEKSYS